MRYLARFFIAAIVVPVSAAVVFAQDRQAVAALRTDSFVRVARAQSRSVVFLHTIERNGRPNEAEGLGSGVVVGPDGLILTNAHVIENASEVHVRLADRTDVATTVIGRDPASDLALLRATEATGLVPVVFGDSALVEAGTPVVAIGNPLGLHHTVTAGIVSAIARADENSGLEFLQTDAAINPGSSGGGLFDLRGRLVGITSNIVAPRSGGNIGLNFAIPVSVIKVVLPQLRTGVVRHGWLGVATRRVRAPKGAATGGDGVALEILNVAAEGPAEWAGLKPGDVLTGAVLSGRRLAADRIPHAVWLGRPESIIAISVWRDGRIQNLRATLAAAPAEPER